MPLPSNQRHLSPVYASKFSIFVKPGFSLGDDQQIDQCLIVLSLNLWDTFATNISINKKIKNTLSQTLSYLCNVDTVCHWVLVWYIAASLCSVAGGILEWFWFLKVQIYYTCMSWHELKVESKAKAKWRQFLAMFYCYLG